MSEPAFTTAQREVLEPLFGLVGKLIGGAVYTQIRLTAIEELLRERRLVTAAELEEADRRATARWRSGLLIDSLLDPDLATLLEEMRRRMQGDEEPR